MRQGQLFRFALATSALFGSACASGSTTETFKPPVAVVLVDGSSSAADPAIVKRYGADFELVVGWVGAHNGELFADVVGPDALATASVPVSVSFRADEDTPNNPFYKDLSLREKQAEAAKQADALFDQLASKPFNESDIVSAVVAASRLFAARSAASERVLVVQSDMAQFGGQGGNFYADDLSGAGINAKLTSLREAGLVPDLQGVVVYVTGAGVSAKRDLDQQRILGIERFWRAYFKAAGASIPAGGYGARLVALVDSGQ